MQKEENNQERKETTELSFLGELKRRKVFRAAAAYLVVAWLVIQAASIVLPTFDVPAGSMRLVIIMATLGFPLVIVLAWAFELTPEGMKLTPDANNQDPETVSPKQNRKRNIAAFAFLVPMRKTPSSPVGSTRTSSPISPRSMTCR
jgi:hypothetical protein